MMDEEERARLADQARACAVRCLLDAERMIDSYSKESRESAFQAAEIWSRIYHADVLRGG